MLLAYAPDFHLPNSRIMPSGTPLMAAFDAAPDTKGVRPITPSRDIGKTYALCQNS